MLAAGPPHATHSRRRSTPRIIYGSSRSARGGGRPARAAKSRLPAAGCSPVLSTRLGVCGSAGRAGGRGVEIGAVSGGEGARHNWKRHKRVGLPQASRSGAMAVAFAKNWPLPMPARQASLCRRSISPV
jgi:hypothetical protein